MDDEEWDDDDEEVEPAPPIIQAAEDGDLEEVRRLVQHDHQLLDAEWSFDTPLTAAAWKGRVEVVRYLLDEGADINLRPGGSHNPLVRACYYGHVEVVALLLARGAETGPLNDGWTPLVAASQEGRMDVVKVLLAHGCVDIDQQYPGSRETALHWACIRARAGVVEVLLGAGADPHLVDRNGHTPLSWAVLKGRVECVAVLEVSMVYMQVLDWWHQGFNHAHLLMSASHVRSGSAATS
jgi:ankyrin repeat protein